MDDKIDYLRDELNRLILNNANYDEIYRLSVALDDLIIKYYANYKKNNIKN
ncbi:Spo0E family sporulation regulatory protein-aspartic acid phosphatase [Clostridium sp. D2Q-11]|uniref:Spo0E family sporulation regulatory protein-aspartic acid phosphatase n=1 Tax=Anaeromonas frigoriresistens TaxID=2683708 RepID=A0A942ZAT6_9FIRM|nr:Spo0E family sporulation regulatory protein-aspartic acid phosphatase [Anaeromonas frigoriresistens]